jgi:MinD-like ATPase involved in chromosome partitioning or flagellar assembly
MIRDLRYAQYRTTSPPSRSLAFAREDITRAAAVSSVVAGAKTDRALTIAVTAPRALTCKRGFAANFAAHLAARVTPLGSSVCIVDTDLESRDVGIRFDVTAPTLLEVANDLDLRDGRRAFTDAIAKVDPPGLHVVPTRLPQSALVPLLHSKTPALLGSLRAAFDFVVVDAPVAVGLGTFDWERTMLRQVDVLLVAVTAEASGLGGVLRYLNAIASAKHNGALAETFDAHVVLTGRDEDGTRTLLGEHDIERKLRGIPVIASVPQLWGRQRPDTALDLEFHQRLHAEFGAIVDRVTEDRNRSDPA